MSVSTATVAPAPRGAAKASSNVRPASPVAGAGGRAPLWRSVGSILASQAVLGVAGIATLPLLARNLGPERYGDFSLFVTLLGVVVYQDFARQLLVREETLESAAPSERSALARLSTLAIVVLALGAGAFVLQPMTAALLAGAVLLHGLASHDWARISARGRIVLANSSRNYAWAAAFAATTALSFLAGGPWTYAVAFLAANLALLCVYRRAARQPEASSVVAPAQGSLAARWSGYATLRRSPHFERYRREAFDLLGFTVASSVMVAADRVLLDKTASPEALGLYVGHSDLALKINVFGTALASALYPIYARVLRDEGDEAGARRAVRIASAVVPAYFVAIAVLIAAERSVVGLLLGPSFAAGPHFYPLFLLGVFVQLFGYLISPWQRARGDFASQRRAYQHGAIAMVAVGVVTIPWLGAGGALVAYACSRVAEIELTWAEVRRIPREVLPRWKVAAAAAMFLALAAFAVWTSLGGGAA